MNETTYTPPVTDYDVALTDYLDKVIELDNAGKVEHLSTKQVFSAGAGIIKKAQARERAEQIKAYQFNVGYAV